MDVVGYMDAKNLGNDLEFGPFVQLCPPSSAAANSPNVAVGGKCICSSCLAHYHCTFAKLPGPF